MEHPMMQCGHAANATNGAGRPSCAICVGIHPGAELVADAGPDLEGRQAKCFCGKTVPSSLGLAFFEFRGEGSREAVEGCKNCYCFLSAHDPQRKYTESEPPLVCGHFDPRGPQEFDRFYCGCRGFN